MLTSGSVCSRESGCCAWLLKEKSNNNLHNKPSSRRRKKKGQPEDYLNLWAAALNIYAIHVRTGMC